MHSYQHNIKTFNNATRHLTRVERALYRDLIEIYYDTEKPLTSDFSRLCRLVIANSDDEKIALKYVLSEFFDLLGDVFVHHYCEEQIEKYRDVKTAKARAGVASANAKKVREEVRKDSEFNTNQHVLNSVQHNSTNHEPETMNHILIPSSFDNDVDAKKTENQTKQKIPYEMIFDEFNNICVSLPKTLIRDVKRKSIIKTIWVMDLQHRDIDFFKWFFNRVENSDFLTGRKTEWKASFDWVMKPSNFRKIIEGNYDNGK